MRPRFRATKTGLGFSNRIVLLVLVGVLFGTLALSGCGLVGSDSPTPTPTNTPRAAVEAPPSDTSVQTSLPATSVGLPAIADLVERVEPAVVSIVVEGTEQTFFGPRQSVSAGSGVVFRDDGYILTNNHVVEGAVTIRVTFNNGRKLIAEIIGTDPADDLAVIKVDAADLPSLPMGDISSTRVGDWVVAIGNAVGLRGKPTVTMGIVSALDRSLSVGNVQYNDLIQTDASINPGNSGGPLINLNGEVIGINSVVLRTQTAEGLGFAISAATASMAAEQLIDNGKVTWPRLGVFIGQDSPALTGANMDIFEGVVVTDTVSGAPAERAGIKVNDVIVAIDDKPTPNPTALQRLLRGDYRVGEEVVVTVMRGGETKTFDLTLAGSDS